MPAKVVETTAAAVGGGQPASRCMYLIAAWRRSNVLTASSARASAARKAATVSGEAGSAVRPWIAHQSVKRATAAR
jgi:hypothetical protein